MPDLDRTAVLASLAALVDEGRLGLDHLDRLIASIQCGLPGQVVFHVQGRRCMATTRQDTLHNRTKGAVLG